MWRTIGQTLFFRRDASPDNPGNVNATCAKHKTAWILAGMSTGM